MKPEDFRVVYAGTPDFAVPALASLIDAGYNVVAVYTQPDRRAGRGRRVQFSPVKSLALEHNIKVEQPHSMRDADQLELLQSYQSDLMVVAAFGQILPLDILQTPVHGCLNIHASLLPRWRGAAPIQRAIQQGDRRSGVTIMQMAEGLDTGDMLYKAESNIECDTTAAELHDTLAEIGSDALIKTLALLHDGKLNPQRQSEEESCYAAKLQKSEAIIDWSESALQLHRKVCAFNAWPVAQTTLAGEIIRVWQSALVEDSRPQNNAVEYKPGQVVSSAGFIDVATGDGLLRLLTLQPPGKKAMPVSHFLNSRNIPAGTSLG